MISVSVPSRGLSYLNLEKQLQENKNLGFRPLTGTLLSKQNENDLQSNLYRDGFRPLTGTLLSKLKHKCIIQIINSFRPLTGTLLSKQGICHLKRKSRKEFPSPHGDSLI